MALKRWLHRRFNRIVLGVLFGLEKKTTVIARACLVGSRFKMWVDWQGHVPYVTRAHVPELFENPKKYAGAVDLGLDVHAQLDSATMILKSNLFGPKGRMISFELMGEHSGFLEKMFFSMD